MADYTKENGLLPFVREQNIIVFAHGMRPGAKVHFFFDGENVDAYTRGAKLDSSATEPFTKSDFTPIMLPGEPIKVNTDGSVFAQIHIPARTFYTGDREIAIADVSDYNSISTATTKSSIIFHAFNYIVSEDPVNVDPAAKPSSSGAVTISGKSVRPLSLERTRDPLSQTFIVTDDVAQGQDGIYVSKIDLYFKTKDDEQGITVEIRQVENGYPTKTVVPFSRVFKQAANINTSNNAATATTFDFEDLVYLSAGKEYAFVIIPDGNSPEYQIYTSTSGEADLTSGDTVVENWGDGVLFYSTNGTAWTAVQDEDIKFKLYRADFNTANTGTLTLTNKDYEFFTINTTNRTFLQGEDCFKVSTALAGNVNWERANNVLTGTGTSFLTDFADGQKIVVNTDGFYDVLKIKSIANNTSLTIYGFPKQTANGTGLHYKTITGVVDFFSRNNNELIITDSSANSTNYFAANDNIIGSLSGANCNITSVDNFKLNRFQPVINRTSVQGTSLKLNVTGTDSAYSAIAQTGYSIGSTNHVLKNEVIVASKSNEINNLSGNKSLTATVTFNNQDLTDGSKRRCVSPSVNIDPFSFISYENIINNDLTSENTRNGAASSKYITQSITLADEMDSEDIRVYVTAHRPSGTDITVYAKILNKEDVDNFVDKDWSLLENITGADTYSDNSVVADWKEYVYSFKTTPASTALNGGIVSCTTGNNVVTGSGTDFSSGGQLAEGDYVIIFDSEINNDFQVARVSTSGIDVDNVTLTLDEPLLFTNTSATIKKVTYPNSAYKNPQNGSIVRYSSASGVNYDTYKFYAIKIVLTSTSTNLIPRIDDVRTIALSV